MIVHDDSAALPTISRRDRPDGASEAMIPATILLAVLERSLAETISKLEDTGGAISERVLKQGLTSDLELIVRLQALDRIQQEFSAYADILKHCVIRLTCPEDGAALKDSISGITLADLQKRFLDRCLTEMAMNSQSSNELRIY